MLSINVQSRNVFLRLYSDISINITVVFLHNITSFILLSLSLCLFLALFMDSFKLVDSLIWYLHEMVAKNMSRTHEGI